MTNEATFTQFDILENVDHINLSLVRLGVSSKLAWSQLTSTFFPFVCTQKVNSRPELNYWSIIAITTTTPESVETGFEPATIRQMLPVKRLPSVFSQNFFSLLMPVNTKLFFDLIHSGKRHGCPQSRLSRLSIGADLKKQFRGDHFFLWKKNRRNMQSTNWQLKIERCCTKRRNRGTKISWNVTNHLLILSTQLHMLNILSAFVRFIFHKLLFTSAWNTLAGNNLREIVYKDLL